MGTSHKMGVRAWLVIDTAFGVDWVDSVKWNNVQQSRTVDENGKEICVGD